MVCQNNAVSASNHQPFVLSFAADVGSSSDSLNLRQPQVSSLSMPPFSVALNDSSARKPAYKWRRVLLEVSGEAPAGDQTQNIDQKITMSMSREVASVTRLGIEVGCNCCWWWKYFSGSIMGREHGAVALIALLLITLVNAEVVLKATNVDGVYDDDPRCNPNARLLGTRTYQDVISKELSVMDLTAITLCQESNIPAQMTKFRKIGRPTGHRMSMLRTMVSQLVKHERLETTVVKAKEVLRLADNMVQLGKEGTLSAARNAAAFVRGDDVLHKLFTELAYRYKDRAGGYTRVLRTRIRVGDAAPMAYIEFIDRENELRQAKPPVTPPRGAPLDPWTRSRLTRQYAPPKEERSSDSDG